MNKERIKEVALRLFARKGYEQTSLSMITAEVGIKTPSFYAFYKSKEELFLTIVEEVFAHYYEHISSVFKSVSSETTEKKLLKILQEMYNFHLREVEETDFYRRFMMFSPEGLQERFQEEFRNSDKLLSNMLGEIFQKAIDNGEVRKIELEDLVASFLCLMDGLFTQLFYYDKVQEKLEYRLKLNWTIYWAGIKADKAANAADPLVGSSSTTRR